MRVLICRSNPIAPDPRVEKEAKALAEAGYEVTALGWDRGAVLPLVEERMGINIHRLHIKAKFGNGLGNLPALMRWQVGLMSWLIRNRNLYDAIHACDFDTILPALLAKILFGKKVVYDIFDFYAAHLRRTPEWIKNLIRSADYWAISKADAVIIVDDSRREQIHGSKPKRLDVIYNSPEDVRENITRDDAAYSEAMKFRLAYIGLLQVERGLFEMLDVLKRHTDWGLVMAGFGGDEVEIAAQSKGSKNVNFLGRIPYEPALRLSLAADALFATYDPSIPNHRYSSPNKVFEAMMLGKPIVVCHDTNMDRMIENADCGLVIPYADVNALENALTQLANDSALRERLGRNGRIAYETQYGWHIMQARLLDLYRFVSGPG